MHTIALLSLVVVVFLAGCVVGVPAATPPTMTTVPPTAASSTVATTSITSPSAPPHTALFADTFDDPSSGWGTGATAGGDVRYANGQLVFETAASGSWLWSKFDLPAAKSVLRLEATLSASGTGYQGLLCGGTDAEIYGGVLKSDGRWVFMRLTGEGSAVLRTGVDGRWAVAANAPVRIALDCAAAAGEPLQMQLSLPDVGLGVIHDAGAPGPPAFDRVGIYAEAASDAFTMRADDVAAFSAP